MQNTTAAIKWRKAGIRGKRSRPAFSVRASPHLLTRKVSRSLLMAALLVLSWPALCERAASSDEQKDGGEQAGENASNPLAKVRNTDLRWQHFDLGDGADLNDLFVEGSFMATDKLKIKYELHYWETNATGRSEQDWEALSLKGIYFPMEGALGTWKYRAAIGLEWVLDFNHQAKGIGSGADILSPFVGVALLPRPGTTLIPLVQQFLSYNGNDVNTTAFRLIALQTLPQEWWVKADAKAPIEWENDNAVPATAELQLGKHLSRSFALYADGLVGIGGDRPYDYGLGVGLRFKY